MDIWSDSAGDGDHATTFTLVHPPTARLLAAAAVAAASIGCRILGQSALLHDPSTAEVIYGAGYVLATFVGLGLTAAFSREDLRRREDSTYSPKPWTGRAQVAVAALCILAAVANVWAVATLLAS